MAFPASAASDRYRAARDRGGWDRSSACVALIGLLLTDVPALIAVFAACWSMGWQAFQVVQSPYMTEHSEPDHRNELFAIQFAIQSVTNIIAAVLGAVVATLDRRLCIGLDPDGPGTYRVILVDHVPAHGRGPGDRGAARRRPPEPGRGPAAAGRSASRRRSRRIRVDRERGWGWWSATAPCSPGC